MSGTQLDIPTSMHIPTEVEPPVERELSARERMMASIVERAQEQRTKDLIYGEEQALEARHTAAAGSPDLATAFADEDAEAAAEREEAATEAARKALETAPPASRPAAAPVATTAPQAAPALRTVTIDGSQFQVTEQQFEQLARDGAIARATVAQYQRQPAPQQQPQPRAVEPPRPLLADDEADDLARGIIYGDQNSARQSIQRLAATVAQRMPQQHIDQNAIAQHVQAQVEQRAAVNANLNAIGAEFPEIFRSNKLSQLAALTLGEIRQRDSLVGNNRSDLEVYREACQTVRAEVGLPSTSQPAPAVSQVTQAAPPAQSRIERKRAAPALPQASDRRAGQQAERPFPSNAEIVERMRATRGQVPMR